MVKVLNATFEAEEKLKGDGVISAAVVTFLLSETEPIVTVPVTVVLVVAEAIILTYTVCPLLLVILEVYPLPLDVETEALPLAVTVTVELIPAITKLEKLLLLVAAPVTSAPMLNWLGVISCADLVTVIEEGVQL